MAIRTIVGARAPYLPGVATSFISTSGFARNVLDRIENYTGRWFGPREVTWLIDGPSAFHPPVDATIQSVEFNSGNTWEAAAPAFDAYLGYDLDRSGLWKLAGTAGSPDPLPEPFAEAYLRLGEYLAAGMNLAGGQLAPGQDEYKQWAPGVRSFTISDGAVSTTQQRAGNWKADALRLSGAADLLRYHRRPR